MLTLKELMQYGDDLVDEIEELENEQELNDFGSYAYDQTNMEIESLSLKLDALKKEIMERFGNA